MIKWLVNRGWIYRFRIIIVAIVNGPGSNVDFLFKSGCVLISFDMLGEGKKVLKSLYNLNSCLGITIMIAPSYDWVEVLVISI